jgi:hypothetical protein
MVTVSQGAVHQLLLRKTYQHSRSDKMSTFEGTSG